MVIQPSPPVPHKEQEIRLKATETTSNSVVMVSKHTRRERLAQASMDSSEKQTNVSNGTMLLYSQVLRQFTYAGLLLFLICQTLAR